MAAAGALLLTFPALVPMASAAADPITFTSKPGIANLVAHYTVMPTSGTATAAPAPTAATRQMPRLLPKGQSAAHNPALSKVSGTSIDAPNLTTPAATASFIGQQGSNVTCSYFPHGCNPPDMALAAGNGMVLQGVNTSWALYDTAGNLQAGWPVSAQQFFAIPSNTCDPASGGQPFMSDPRAFFDPSTGRFWVAELRIEGAAALGIAPDCPLLGVYYVAVSQTGNPSGAWNVYEFDMTLGKSVITDYTQFGMNNDAVFFSSNIFNLAGTRFDYAEIVEANKAQMEAGSANFTADAFLNLRAHGPGGNFLADTVQPALDLNPGDAGPAVFADTIDGPDPATGATCSNIDTDACTGLAVWTMLNPIGHDTGGPGPKLIGTRTTVAPYAFPPAQTQPGCTACVDGNDLRIPGTPVLKNGIVYTAWDTAIDNGTNIVDGIEFDWTHVNSLGISGASTSGHYFFSGDMSASYPAVAPMSNGDTLMVFDDMSSTVNPETRFIVGGTSFTGPGVLLKAGEAPYRPGVCGTQAVPVCRWGDYEATSADLAGHIWFASQYANSNTNPTVAPFFGRNWGTWIGAING